MTVLRAAPRREIRSPLEGGGSAPQPLLDLGGVGMADGDQLLFEERFLERHAGSIIAESSVAIVELVANAWDAWATEVDIVWPDRGSRDGVFDP